MIYKDKKEFLSNLQTAKVLGLDVGEKKIGTAILDVNLKIATPHSIIGRKKFASDVGEIKRIISEYILSGIVIGLPLEIDGSEGKNSQSVRQYGRNITKEIDIPVYFEDESFSTKAAHEEMAGLLPNTKKISEIDDKIAAKIILERFISS